MGIHKEIGKMGQAWMKGESSSMETDFVNQQYEMALGAVLVKEP